jgi:dephospho-CoA kinase
MLIIAITGGISTGKSLLSTYIKERGYEVIDSDEEALLGFCPYYF